MDDSLSTSSSSAPSLNSPNPPSRILLQPPRKWTSEHLSAANIDEHDGVLAVDLVGDWNLPNEGDEEFEKLSEHFTKPSKEEILSRALIITDYPGNHFVQAFRYLYAYLLGNGSPRSSAKGALFFLNLAIKLNIRNERHIQYEQDFEIRFVIPALHARGTLKCDGALLPAPDAALPSLHGNQRFPLCIFSIVGDKASARISKHEVPQLLIQAVTAYNDNPTLDRYTAFVITLDKSVLRLSKGVMSNRYVKDLCEGHILSEKLKVYRSAPYDLLDREERKEFLRLIIGFFRCSNRNENMN